MSTGSPHKIKIWGKAYNPFRLGGDVNAPMSCEVLVYDRPVALGKGYKGYLVEAPNGKTYVAESTTGGIVGKNLTMVKADIRVASLKVMKDQIKQAKLDAEKTVPVSEQEFWRRMGAT